MGAKKNEVTKSFAQWTERAHFSVTFDPGTNGKINGSGIVDRYDGQIITNAEVPVVTPNNHYIFKGWNPEFTEHTVTGNETYTAVYEYVAATVHFNTNGGETINDIEVDRGSQANSVNNPRHKDGVFVGWYSDNGLQNVVDLSTWKMPTPAVETTFYAKWDKEIVKRVVSYVVVGGTANFSTVTKILRDSDGWASVSGSSSLASGDIPTISANTGYDINLISYNPKAPEVGDVITENTVYTITLDRISINIVITLGTEMKLTSGQLSQTVKYNDQLSQVIITCNDGYAWTDVDISNTQKSLPFTINSNENKNTLTLSGAVNTTNKNITYTIPNPSPTINYKPETGNNLALVSLKESSGSYTKWTQWTDINSVIPKYDFGKPMRLNYTNLQTGGLNAFWALFGDHPFSNLTTNNYSTIQTGTNEVNVDWGFSVEQIELIKQHVGEIIMLHDDSGKKSGFCFEVEPYKKNHNTGGSPTQLKVIKRGHPQWCSDLIKPGSDEYQPQYMTWYQKVGADKHEVVVDPSDLSQVDFTHGGPYVKFADEFWGYPHSSWDTLEYYTLNAKTGKLEFFSDGNLESWTDPEYRWFTTLEELKSQTYEQLHNLTIYVYWEYGEDPDFKPGAGD